MQEQPVAEVEVENEFDDTEAEEILEAGEEEVDVDRVLRDVEQARRKAPKKDGEPAWRRLERLREERHTAELISDFEDYDIGLEGDAGARVQRAQAR